jgi:hypothetical protein
MLGETCLGCLVSVIIIVLVCMLLGFFIKIFFFTALSAFIIGGYVLGVAFAALIVYKLLKFIFS